MSMTEIIYITYFIGIAVWQYPLLYWIFSTVRNRFFIRRNLRMLTDCEELKQYRPLSLHIKMVIDGAEAGSLFSGPEVFYLVSITCAAGTAFIVSLVESLFLALCCGAFMGIMPYCILHLRLYNQRVARSREGDVLVQELLNNYKIYDYNMKEAIEITAASIDGAPNGKKLLFQLAKGFQLAVTRDEVESLLSQFRYSVDTAWGNVLAANIFFAYIFGIRVDTALEDLLMSITKSRKVVEHGKRENNEARLILKYLAPVSYLLTVVGACRYFGFTLAKFIRYQFGTPVGLKSFLIMAMLYSGGILINGFFSREKMDI